MRKDIRFVPTPPAVVEAMLDLAELTPSDFLLDLGSGDGRIPIQAGIRGVRARGVDIDLSLVSRSDHNAIGAGVTHLVDFMVGDLFRVDLSMATVVTLYLGGSINKRLRPRLENELKPGTRIVSHSFDMPGWEPQRFVEVETKFLFMWTVP